MGGGAEGPFISTDAKDVSMTSVLVLITDGVSSSNSCAFGSMIDMVALVQFGSCVAHCSLV